MALSDARPDTAQRSLAHWSEEGRRSMDGFYALATEDYRRLEAARDLAAYLAGRRDGQRWTFAHEVHLMTWTPRV